MVALAVLAGASSRGLSQTPAEATAKWEISGSVSDDSGGLKDVWVSAIGPEPIRSARTDGQGGYRVEGTVPGLYRIRIEPRDGQPRPASRSIRIAAGMKAPHVDFRLPHGAVLAGRVLDTSGRPVQGALVFALGTVDQAGKPSLRTRGADRTNDLGEYRISGLSPGSYKIAAMPSVRNKIERARENPATAQAAFPLVTFYPASANADGAISIEVDDGAERSGIELTLERLPAHCVRFSATPAGSGEGDLYAQLTYGSYNAGGLFPAGKIKAGETNEVCGLTRGDYWLQIAQTQSRPLTEFGIANQPLHIVDRDVDLGTIALTAPIELSGSVVFSTNAASPSRDAPSADSLPAWVRLRFSPINRQYFPSDLRQQSIEGGKFHGRVAYPGDAYRIELFGLPDGYRLVSAKQGGASVNIEEFRPGEGELTLIVDPRGATIEGRVRRGDSEAAPRATVLLLSSDGRSFAAADADQEGFYRFSEGLPEGRYRVVALEGLVDSERESRQTLERFASKATDVEISTGEREQVDLEVVRAR